MAAANVSAVVLAAGSDRRFRDQPDLAVADGCRGTPPADPPPGTRYLPANFFAISAATRFTISD
jgi:hypothetical protein